MQTTLRIDDQLYREAKAEAARQGMTLTRFLEEGLQMRLRTQTPARSRPHRFPTYDPGKPCAFTDADIRRIDNEEQERFYLRKLGINRSAA